MCVLLPRYLTASSASAKALAGVRGGAPRDGSLPRFISGLRCTQKAWISGWKYAR